jgi:hypothetical protein
MRGSRHASLDHLLQALLDAVGVSIDRCQRQSRGQRLVPLLLRLRNTDVETWAVMMSIATG